MRMRITITVIIITLVILILAFFPFRINLRDRTRCLYKYRYFESDTNICVGTTELKCEDVETIKSIIEKQEFKLQFDALNEYTDDYSLDFCGKNKGSHVRFFINCSDHHFLCNNNRLLWCELTETDYALLYNILEEYHQNNRVIRVG